MIYLDHNATTQPHPEVVEVMLPFLTDRWGNPSSSYAFGADLRKEIERARTNVAALIGAQPDEIVFTSGATEANYTAILSALQSSPSKRHIVTTAVEHPSILAKCEQLERVGVAVTYLSVNREGLLSLDELDQAIRPDTALVSVMWANNETGVVFPVGQIAEVCAKRGVLFHCDAVQAIGRCKVDLTSVRADFLTLSGHKFYGPRGVGALFCRRGKPFSPVLVGGHQERGKRGGTENVAAIVGLSKAAEIVSRSLYAWVEFTRKLRDLLERKMLDSVHGVTITGSEAPRLPNTSNISFGALNADALLMLLDRAGVCASTGSACLADSDQPSHVIQAMLGKHLAARNVIRFSVGPTNTEREIHDAASIVTEARNALS